MHHNTRDDTELGTHNCAEAGNSVGRDMHKNLMDKTMEWELQGNELLQQWTPCQQLLSAYEDRVIDFQCFVPEEKGFLFWQITNADQIPLNFHMPQSGTVRKKGAKSVLIKTSSA